MEITRENIYAIQTNCMKLHCDELTIYNNHAKKVTDR